MPNAGQCLSDCPESEHLCASDWVYCLTKMKFDMWHLSLSIFKM